MLGEALPPLRLLLHDSHGNAVPADAASWAERQVQLQVLQGSVAGGGAVLQELNVVADTVSVDAAELQRGAASCLMASILDRLCVQHMHGIAAGSV
jgi:hypothetical protein